MREERQSKIKNAKKLLHKLQKFVNTINHTLLPYDIAFEIFNKTFVLKTREKCFVYHFDMYVE